MTLLQHWMRTEREREDTECLSFVHDSESVYFEFYTAYETIQYHESVKPCCNLHAFIGLSYPPDLACCQAPRVERERLFCVVRLGGSRKTIGTLENRSLIQGAARFRICESRA